MARIIAAAVVLTSATALDGPVLVTGATGRTGSIIYTLLKEKGVDVRGFVRNTTKAREVLGCTACDESDGIFVGDITEPDTLVAPTEGATAMVIATSTVIECDASGCHCVGPKPIDADWKGERNQVRAIATAAAKAAAPKPTVALISTTLTTKPDAPFPDHMAFYKLNGETALMESSLPFVVAKPCTLDDGEAGAKRITVDHDDALSGTGTVARADVARLLVEALMEKEAALRFDVCSSTEGSPTSDDDLEAVIKAAKYPWQRQERSVL